MSVVAVSLKKKVSADGRYVAFTSMASNLVMGDTNNYLDVFVHDRLSRQTVRASVSTMGMQAMDDCFSPSLSGDGRFVAFFFQAEDGIRDLTVTGVQTCALPISAFVKRSKLVQPAPYLPIPWAGTVPAGPISIFSRRQAPTSIMSIPPAIRSWTRHSSLPIIDRKSVV